MQKPKATLLSGTQYKEEILDKMNWLQKEKQRTVGGADISISVQTKNRGNAKDGGKVVCVTFRNGCHDLITDTEYIQLGVYKNRVFIRQVDSADGYKLSKPGGTARNRYVKMPGVDVLKDFIGDYELKYDNFLDMYYVEKEQ